MTVLCEERPPTCLTRMHRECRCCRPAGHEGGCNCRYPWGPPPQQPDRISADMRSAVVTPIDAAPSISRRLSTTPEGGEAA